jgi:hypothetical protein
MTKTCVKIWRIPVLVEDTYLASNKGKINPQKFNQVGQKYKFIMISSLFPRKSITSEASQATNN